MTAAAVTPASFSFRTLVLLSAFAPMLLLPEVSVAFLSGPLEPLYYGPQVVPQRIGFSCSDPTLSVTPPSQQSVTYCGASTTPFGYLYGSIPAPTRSTLFPLYLVGSVIYVPPGSGGSSVQYGQQTQIGTTVTTEQTWSQDGTNHSYGGELSGNGDSVTFGDSFGGSTSTSVDMQSTSAANQKFNGPASNAINHDYDQIILYMGVQMPVSIDYLGNVTWALDFSQVASSGHPADGFFAMVGCLNPNSALYNSADCVAQQNILA